MKTNYFYAILLLLTVTGQVVAQDDLIKFHKVGGISGEPIGKINGISQDPYGYLWLCGQDQECVYRYDGVRLLAYRHDNLDDNSLGGVNLETIYADTKGIVWIGFGGEGVDRFDPAAGTFTHFRHNAADTQSLSDDYVNVIAEDRKGQLWIGTSNGLNRLDESTGKFTRYVNDIGNPKSLSDNFIQEIYEDHDRALWIGTGLPWHSEETAFETSESNIATAKGGLNRMESDGSFTRFLHDPKNPNTLINNKVRSIFEDSRGVFWIGTSGDGLHTMDKKTGRVMRHPYDAARPDKLSRPPRNGDEFQFNNELITFITEDRLGGIWIGSMWNGVNRFDPATNRITRFDATDSYGDEGAWDAFRTSDGTLWIASEGTKANLHRVEIFQRGINSVELGVTVRSLLEDSDGTVWAGTPLGLYHLDKDKTVLEQFTVNPDQRDHPSNRIICMFRASDDLLQFGTAQGMWNFSKSRKSFTPSPLGGKFANEELGLVISIMKDHEGVMWIGTQKGLARYRPEDGIVKWYTADSAIPGAIRSDHIITIAETTNSVWVGTFDGGLNRLDTRTDTFSQYFKDAKQPTMYVDAAGILWVGSPTGIYRYDETSDSFSLLGANSIIGTDRTYGIIEDGENNLWVATTNAITRVDADRDELFTFGRHIGVKNISVSSIYKAANGELWVGHDSGFYTFDPRQLGKEQRPMHFLISNLEVNDLPIRKMDTTKLHNEDVERMELTHSQNNIFFKYAVDDYRAPEAAKYFTMMEGYDNVWREATADKASYFFNIPFGSYVYRVKAYNAFGAKVEKAITIVIHPPWWRTWWAYSAYAFMGIAFASLGRREIVRRERSRSIFKLEHVELEKAKEVDRVKSSFFANISHEFRTPLTLIKGHAADLREEFSRYPKAKSRLKLIESSSDLLLRLINQLLDLAKLESGNLIVNRSEFDLNMFLKAITGSFSSLADQKNVVITTSIPSVRYVALFDRDKVETILINLLNNAIKFTPAGGNVNLGATLSISQAAPQGPATLTIQVTDTGIGIPPDKQAKVFERFYQVSEVHREVGTGIGLALVKEFAALMGGTIHLKSEVGKGSAFTLTFPIDIARVLEEDEELVAMEPESLIEGNGTAQAIEQNLENGYERPRVLVVEDNRDLMNFIISCLGKDFDFLEASDGKQGLELAVNEVPDIIISDVMMPEMDGIKMTTKIKSDLRSSHIPVILLTAKASDESKMEGLNTGASDYLTKPFNRNELVLKIKNAISVQRKAREKIRLELLSDGPRLTVLSADEAFLVKVKETILSRLADEQLGVESLARDIGLSRAHLYRKITALTGTTVNDLIKSLRLQRASQLLSQNWGPVSQVAYEVGFSNPSYFSKCFKEQFGTLPSDYALKT